MIYIVENPYAKEKPITNIITQNQSPSTAIERQRIPSLDPYKVYARVFIPKSNPISRMVVYIGLNVFRLIEFDVLNPVHIDYKKKENLLIVYQSDDEISMGYTISKPNSPNALNFTFKIPKFLHFHPFITKEVQFDFNDKQLILNFNSILSAA